MKNNGFRGTNNHTDKVYEIIEPDLNQIDNTLAESIEDCLQCFHIFKKNSE